jgi:hypothetical protein
VDAVVSIANFFFGANRRLSRAVSCNERRQDVGPASAAAKTARAVELSRMYLVGILQLQSHRCCDTRQARSVRSVARGAAHTGRMPHLVRPPNLLPGRWPRRSVPAPSHTCARRKVKSSAKNDTKRRGHQCILAKFFSNDARIINRYAAVRRASECVWRSIVQMHRQRQPMQHLYPWIAWQQVICAV